MVKMHMACWESIHEEEDICLKIKNPMENNCTFDTALYHLLHYPCTFGIIRSTGINAEKNHEKPLESLGENGPHSSSCSTGNRQTRSECQIRMPKYGLTIFLKKTSIPKPPSWLHFHMPKNDTSSDTFSSSICYGFWVLHMQQKRAVSKQVPFPFGFSSGCEIPLNCTESDETMHIGEFPVYNITSDTIMVNFPQNCLRPIEAMKPLFTDNFAPDFNTAISPAQL
nr:wall-associated receptor kinase-like 14 [Ipomoea batatas]